MSMTNAFGHILEQTGFISLQGPSDGLLLPDTAASSSDAFSRYAFMFDTSRFPLKVDGLFRTRNTPVLVMRDATSDEPSDSEMLDWHRLSWNFGLAPLLWIATPSRVLLLNSYAAPALSLADVTIAEFDIRTDRGIRNVTAVCGRLAFDTGAFWKSPHAYSITRRDRVDVVLLREMAALEHALRGELAEPLLAQKLIGRAIFSQYLADRGLLSAARLTQLFGKPTLPELLDDPASANALFDWMKSTFNGDLFPPDLDGESERVTARSLSLISDFLKGLEISTGQWRLFPFRFDVIPVELISSIYEQFAHSIAGEDAAAQGLHYTPINLVDLALDTVMEDLSGTSRVLDPACGSGVFLVEAMRRIVWRRSQYETCTRAVVRDVLYNQICGVDINLGALQVTAFSLYLAALELDPELNEQEPNWLQFDTLIGKTLHHASFFETPQLGKERFDIVIGNPPWTYASGSAGARHGAPTHLRVAQPRRSPDWAFLWHARELAAPGAKISLLMKATPFFSKDRAANDARRLLLTSFQDVRLVNLSQLRVDELFPTVPSPSDGKKARKATKGAALLFSGRVGPARENETVAVANIPWTENFKQSGILDVAGEMFKDVAADRIRENPILFKAAMFGNAREFGVMENLGFSPDLLRLADWCDHHGLSMEQGVQIGGGNKNPCDHLNGMPYLDAAMYTPGRISIDLPIFDAPHAHRPRQRQIYNGPLVICPEAAFARAVERGRYSAAISAGDLVFSDSFVGISFAGKDPKLAALLAAVLNSKVVAFQLTFGGSNIGLKLPKVEKMDLDALLIPELTAVGGDVLKKVAGLQMQLSNRTNAMSAIRQIDEIVMDLYGLTSADRRVIDDVLHRSRPVFMDTRQDRQATVTSVRENQLLEYGGELAHWLDTVLQETGHFRSTIESAIRVGPDVIALRLDLEDGPVKPLGPFRLRAPELFEMGLLEALGGHALPAFQASRFLRVYVDRSIYIVKPDETRYWHVSDAQSDLELVLEDHRIGRERLSHVDTEAVHSLRWKPALLH